MVDSNPASIDDILTDMKNNGLNAAIIRNDGILISSTIQLNESNASIISLLTNVSDAILKGIGDKQKEIEISMEGMYLIIISLGNHILCGIIKNREEKKNLRYYADKIKQIL